MYNLTDMFLHYNAYRYTSDFLWYKIVGLHEVQKHTQKRIEIKHYKHRKRYNITQNVCNFLISQRYV